jgi:hypothetical protein
MYVNDLESGSTPKIAKAAHNIAKNNISGYSLLLLETLQKEMKKPRAWKSQCKLIRALGLTNSQESLGYLKQLIDEDYDSTVLYRELAFSIFTLENYVNLSLSFLYHSLQKGNDLQISGCCAGVLYNKAVPKKEDIRKIIDGVSPYTEDEGRVKTPRCYIAAVAYLWPREETEAFLKTCRNSVWSGLVEIANSSLQGKKPRLQLVS